MGGGVQGQLWSCICGGEGEEGNYLSHNGGGGKITGRQNSLI